MNDTPKVRRIPAYRKNPHLMKAAIYVRVSSSRVEQLRSLSNQVSAMTRCVYLMQNWILKDIYLEVASAKTDSYRREFNRLLDDCKKQEIEVVVVKSLSRFGRDNVEVIDSIRALVNAGVTIYFMEEDIDVDADYPEWELSIRSAINQAENEHRSENIKMGLRYRAESGNSGEKMGIWRKTRRRRQLLFAFLTCTWTGKATAASSMLWRKSISLHQGAVSGGARKPSKLCSRMSNIQATSK